MVIVLFILLQIWKKRTQKKFADLALLKRLTPNRSDYKSTLKLLFFIVGIALLTLGLVNPKIGTKLETVKREGVDIVFAVDVSKSMLAEDIAPNRVGNGIERNEPAPRHTPRRSNAKVLLLRGW